MDKWIIISSKSVNLMAFNQFIKLSDELTFIEKVKSTQINSNRSPMTDSSQIHRLKIKSSQHYIYSIV